MTNPKSFAHSEPKHEALTAWGAPSSHHPSLSCLTGHSQTHQSEARSLPAKAGLPRGQNSTIEKKKAGQPKKKTV